MSLITVIFDPDEPNARIADSLHGTGSFNYQLPHSSFHALWLFYLLPQPLSEQAKGVDFLEPLNPLLSEEDHENFSISI